MTLPLLADANVDRRIVLGLVRLRPSLDIVRAQEVELTSTDDPNVLASAAQSGRILITHDFKTMIGYANERVQHGQRMPGVIAVRERTPIGRAIEDILVVLEASREGELGNQIRFVPL